MPRFKQLYQLVIMVIKTNLEPKRGFFQTGPGNSILVWLVLHHAVITYITANT